MFDEFGRIRRELEDRRARDLQRIQQRERDELTLRQAEDQMVQECDPVVRQLLNRFIRDFFETCTIRFEQRTISGVVARWSMGRTAYVLDEASASTTNFVGVWQDEVCVDLIVEGEEHLPHFRCLRIRPEDNLELHCDFTRRRLVDALREIAEREFNLI